jgi:hypothetical protein
MIHAAEGATTVTPLTASDLDGDPLTFHVERVPSFPMRLSTLASSLLTDHGDGSAELSFTPRYTEAGNYALRIAVFDEVGGVDVRDVLLVIEDTQIEGDANCDGQLALDDVPALIAALFGHVLEGQACVTADTNGDGRLAVNDLTALLSRLW